ncbi:MAG TPA: hypothetical protein VN704_04785 [Verrucomicrobiae bacterium]|nr:hypothetical protein [Verrucomicrobiae bacterium]
MEPFKIDATLRVEEIRVKFNNNVVSSMDITTSLVPLNDTRFIPRNQIHMSIPITRKLIEPLLNNLEEYVKINFEESK